MTPLRNSEPDDYGLGVSFTVWERGGGSHGGGTSMRIDSNAFMDWPAERAAADKLVRSLRRSLMRHLKLRRKRHAQ